MSFACDRYLFMHARCKVVLIRWYKVAEVCRRAIFTLPLDRCSYPNDSVRVYRVRRECPLHVPFRSVFFAYRSCTPISLNTSGNLWWPRRTNTTKAPRSTFAGGPTV